MLPLHRWLVLHSDDALEATSSIGNGAAPHSIDSLFALSAEPVLILEAATISILEINPRAAALLDAAATTLLGTSFLSVFDEPSAATIGGCLALAQATGRAETVLIRALHSDAELSARFSLVRASADSYFIVRLSSNAARGIERESAGASSAVLSAIENGSLGFLVTDSAFRIDYANAAFVDMVGLKSQSQLRGSPLVRWLNLSAQHLSRLRVQMSQREACTLITTRLTYRNSAARVEVSAVAVPDAKNICWGFSVRELPIFN